MIQAMGPNQGSSVSRLCGRAHIAHDRNREGGSIWILSLDEASNVKDNGAGITLEGPDGVFIY